MLITPRHDEPDDALGSGTRSKRISRTNPVAHRGTQTRTGNIKQSENSVPAKGFPEGSIVAKDDFKPGDEYIPNE